MRRPPPTDSTRNRCPSRPTASSATATPFGSVSSRFDVIHLQGHTEGSVALALERPRRRRCGAAVHRRLPLPRRSRQDREGGRLRTSPRRRHHQGLRRLPGLDRRVSGSRRRHHPGKPSAHTSTSGSNAAGDPPSRSGTTRVHPGWRRSPDRSPSNSAARRSRRPTAPGGCWRPVIPRRTTCPERHSPTACCATRPARRGVSGRARASYYDLVTASPGGRARRVDVSVTRHPVSSPSPERSR